MEKGHGSDGGFSLAQFQEAQKRLLAEFNKNKDEEGQTLPTLFKRSKWLSETVGAQIYIKLEVLLPGNSFKLRGATHTLLAYKQTHSSLPSRVITASGGNHGLAVAIAAQRMGIPCRIVLPETSPIHRRTVITSFGAEVYLAGAAFDDANAVALEMAKEEGTLYIHPFDNDHVLEGQGTIALEIMEQVPDAEVIIGSLGGGGLLAGVSACLQAAGKSDVKIYSVETEGADYFYQSRAAGQLVTLPSITSIAKTLGAKTSTAKVYGILQSNIVEAFQVSDKEAVEAICAFLNYEKILLEPATSCVVAALLKNKHLFQGKKVVLIICGGNTTLEELQAWRKEFGSELPTAS
jgi:threonine dehydratase